MCHPPLRTRAGCTTSRSRPLRGFTLVELLVVIGIIAVLVAMLFPALRKVRDQSVRTECAQTMHQWALALNAYAAQNKGLFPDNTRGAQCSWVSSEVKDFLAEFMVEMQGWSMNDPGRNGRDDPTCCPAQFWHRSVRERQDPGTGTLLLGYFYFPHQSLTAAGNLGVADYKPAGEGWVTRKRFGGPDRHAPVMADMIQCGTVGDWSAAGHVWSSHVKGNFPTGGNFLFEDGRVEWRDYLPRTADREASIEVGAVIGNWLMWYKIPIPK
jgi:prepilin-type N-terminal cleavage/methylation domain-containing protein